jgi:uncharacterized phage protein (TIGR01671 family)
MNKEFRAWDKETCQMFYPMKDSPLLDIDYCELKLLVADISNGSAEEDDYIVMQFTGLLDKHGIKIFEGDVVKTWRVEWNTGGLGDRYFTEIVKFENGGFTNCINKTKPVEIIGNIYSNPELIKDMK